jgi:Tol biopolymer transport system component
VSQGRRLPLRATLALLFAAITCAALTGCGVHPGGQQIAFLRTGALIALNPDGSNARTLASGSIVSFAWSPDHQQLVYRMAKGGGAADLVPTATVGVPDAAGSLVVTSINGGRGVGITPDASELAWSDAWWNVNGNRLLYRQEFADVDAGAAAPVYVLSQADQPAGIARKPLYNAIGMPALAADGSQVAAIDAGGTLRLGPPGQTGQAVATGALLTLPNTGREGRVLWQPEQDRLLYTSANGANTDIVLRDPHGGARTITTVPALLDMAFTPDGSAVLLRTPDAFELWQAVQQPRQRFTLPEQDDAALAWWSPNGHQLLVRDATGIRVVDVATGAARTLLAYNAGEAGTAIPAQARWHPAVESPWSPDGTSIVFAATDEATWQGKPLPAPRSGAFGLYVAPISGGQPMLIDSGNDRAPSWSTLNPATAVLAAS